MREIFFLTDDQITYLIDYYMNKKDYQKSLYISLSYDSATKRAEIAFIGDSWVEGGEFRKGERLTLPLREKYLGMGYIDEGIGFISFANSHVGNGLV